MARGARQIAERPDDHNLRSNVRRRLEALRDRCDGLERVSLWCPEGCLDILDESVKEHTEQASKRALRKWQEKMADDVAAQRRWIRAGADAEKKEAREAHWRRQRAPAEGSSPYKWEEARAHPAHRVADEAATWQALWTKSHPADGVSRSLGGDFHAVAHSDCVAEYMEGIPPGDYAGGEAEIGADDLIRTVRKGRLGPRGFRRLYDDVGTPCSM